jgi:hypothetical protein
MAARDPAAILQQPLKASGPAWFARPPTLPVKACLSPGFFVGSTSKSLPCQNDIPQTYVVRQQ